MVIFATVLHVVSSIFATTRLAQELFPDIAFPIVTGVTLYWRRGPRRWTSRAISP